MTTAPARREAPLILLVSGSRVIRDAVWVHAQLDAYLAARPPGVAAYGLLLHGGADGVDRIAGDWARGRGLAVSVHRPDLRRWPYSVYRAKAYLERDYHMVDHAHDVVCLWDGHSKGTKIVKDYAEKLGKLRAVVTAPQ